MPTLYTALRARHRHRVTSALHPVPREPERELSLARLQPLDAPTESTRQIVVVGGGLAGLCAAFELKDRFGFQNVRVFEARHEVGGRVRSERDVAAGRILEGGGELIGGNHPLWMAYKQRFGLHFSDVEEYGNAPIRLGGHTLTFEESARLTDELEKEFEALTGLAETVVDPFEPWTNPDAAALDAVSVGHWIATAKCSRRCKRAMAQQLASDNGIPVDEQSLLGVLAMVRGGGLDRYWTDTELFRCIGGNQQVAMRMREALNASAPSVFESSPVQQLIRNGDHTDCIVERDGRLETVRADDVILAIPPSVWNTITVVNDDKLGRLLQAAPALGRNVKFLMSFRRRFWQSFNGAPTLTADGPVDLTWETTEAENTPSFGLVAFSGADDAETCRGWPNDERRTRYVHALAPAFPGIGGELQQTKFMNWPNEDWAKASYYFPRVNEIMQWGPVWKAGHGGWLHFVGEHTCYAFVGYMEGALASGYRLARRIAVRERIRIA